VGLLIQLSLLGIATGALYAPAAMGFGLVLGQSKIFHVAHGGVYLVAGYVFYYASSVWKLPWIVGVGLTALAAAASGLLIHYIAYRPLLAKPKFSFLVGVVASLGVLTIISNLLVLMNGGRFVELDRTVLSTGRLTMGTLYLQYGHIAGILSAVAIVLALQFWLSRTDTGRAVRAISADRKLARVYGIDVERYDILIVSLASLILVPSAVLIASLTGLSGGAGLIVGTFAFTATIIGGLGSVPGTFAAALLLGLAENASLYWLPGAWQQGVGLGIMVIVLLLRPTGLFVSRRDAPSLAPAGG
jgi:branched-subunit amino acid ABC-type transport system permease component